MKFGQRIEQVCYVVNDVRKAAIEHSRLFGSGPFFVIDRMRVESWHRGRSTVFEPNVALGQSGDVMIELLSETSNTPSIINDLYPYGSGKEGIHHLCYHIDNLQNSVEAFEKSGFHVAFKTRFGGTDCVIIDTHKIFGHYVELYERTEVMKHLYGAVRDAAVDFDGSNLLRPLESILGN
jgi:hypothetical protein